MNIFRKVVAVYFLLLVTNCIKAQFFVSDTTFSNRLDHSRSELLTRHRAVAGLTFKLTIDLAKKTELRVSVSAGIQQAVEPFKESNHFLLPSYQIELMCYRGGIGSSLMTTERQKFMFEIHNNINMTIGFEQSNSTYGRPLWKSGSTSANSLYDPYKTSLTLGTTFVNGLNHERNQRVGIMNFGCKRFQVAYLNDATPFHWIWLNDTYDRWLTGALIVSLYEPRKWGNLTEISVRYDRYTGWQQNAFEASGALQLDRIAYKDKREVFLNQGRWQVSCGLNNNTNLAVGFYSRNDLQDFIHYRISHDPWHQRTQKSSVSFGGSYKLNSIFYFQ